MCDVGECARYFSSWHPVPFRPYSYDIRKCVISFPYFGNKIVRRQKVRPSMVCSLYVSIFFSQKTVIKTVNCQRRQLAEMEMDFSTFCLLASADQSTADQPPPPHSCTGPVCL
jgi:hypothetical protein